jgi:hypothetical protein
VFTSFKAIKNFSSSVGASILRPNRKGLISQNASTIFSDSTGPVIKVSYLVPGRKGNNFVANLYKITGTKYRFRLYDNAGVRINTLTQEDNVPPLDVIKELVESINTNIRFKKYIRVTFYKESTEAFSTDVAIENGRRLRGGR